MVHASGAHQAAGISVLNEGGGRPAASLGDSLEPDSLEPGAPSDPSGVQWGMGSRPALPCRLALLATDIIDPARLVRGRRRRGRAVRLAVAHEGEGLARGEEGPDARRRGHSGHLLTTTRGTLRPGQRAATQRSTQRHTPAFGIPNVLADQ